MGTGVFIRTVALFVIMPRIRSGHFRMCRIDEYWRILYVKNQFLRLFVDLGENARECRRIFSVRLFSAIFRELTHVPIRLKVYIPAAFNKEGSYSVH